MRRLPIALTFLILGVGIACVVIYFTVQMRMRTPPQITIVRQQWMPRGNVPNAYLRIHYEMKNTTIFPVSVHKVSIQGPESQFGGDIDAIYPEKDALSMKPGQVHKGRIHVSLPEGASSMEASFLIRWEPGAARRLMPLLYRGDAARRKALNIPPPDPFAPPGSPDAPSVIVWPRDDLLDAMRFALPR